MLNISVKPSFGKLANAFREIADGLNLQGKLGEFAYQIEAEAKRIAPVDTGRLRSSIFTSIGNLEAVIRPDTNYAVFVHEGTRKMQGRPFLLEGFNAASFKMFGSESPFVSHIEATFKRSLSKL